MNIFKGLTELALTYERHCKLGNKTNWFLMTKQRFIISSIIVASIMSQLPDFYVFKFEPLAYNNTYKISKTDFGMSSYYSGYFIAYSTLVVCLLSIYFILIIRVIYTFRTFLARMRSQSNFKRTASKNENNITKYIIITGLLYVFCSIHSIVLVSLNRFDVFKKYYYDFFAVLIRFGYLFVSPLILIFNAIIVFFYDRNLRHVFVTNT